MSISSSLQFCWLAPVRSCSSQNSPVVAMVPADRKPTMHFTHESCTVTNPAECIVELLD
jgi:hypothetical protein